MAILRRLTGFLAVIILTPLYYGWVALITLLRMYCLALRDLCERLRLPGRLAKTADTQCVRISNPAFKRPDPMIYAQFYLMAQGIAVTWDNPDIHIEESGVPVPPHLLKPNTDYQVVARVWNNSTEAPVIGMPVRFSFLSFGIGTQMHPIGQTTINLGVKGGPGQPALAVVPWRTPVTAGHYCLQVDFAWYDDMNPFNNLGQTNTDVVQASSPARSEFQLRNTSKEDEKYRFEVDGYMIPPLVSCRQKEPPPSEPRVSRLAPGTIRSVPSQHQRANARLPAGWDVTFVPSEPSLSPNQETTIRVAVIPPTGFHGRQPLNVHAFSKKGLAGGVTIVVEVP